MDDHGQKQRILSYYKQIFAGSAKQDMLDYLISQMSDQDAGRLEERLQANDHFYKQRKKRLTTYSMAFATLQTASPAVVDPSGRNGALMNEVMEAMGSYDYKSEGKEEINGNTFTFDRNGFPIEKYRDELAELGNTEKGNTWYVQEGEDGKLVIY